MSFAGLRRGLLSVSSNEPNLANLLAEEKDLSAGLAAVRVGIQASGKYLQLWGEQEAGLDLQDSTQKLGHVMSEYALAVVELEDAQARQRDKLKEIKDLSDALYALKAKLKACRDKLDKAVKLNKNAESIQSELTGLERHLMDDSANFEHQKRLLLQESVKIHAEGLIRFSMKTQQIAAFSMHLADQIPLIKLQPAKDMVFPSYMGKDITTQIIYDFDNAIYQVPKTPMAKGKGYSAPQVLNLTALDAIEAKDITGASGGGQETWTRRDIVAEDSTPLKLSHFSAVTQSTTAAAEVTSKTSSTSSVGWTAFSQSSSSSSSSITPASLPANSSQALPKGTTPLQPTSSSSTLLPSHLSDNPW